uniref:Uncharacterized protein n=1 Tax=Tanacetum cinerariifolium TaxID=118510 RepID=A0A6L2JRL7_TANCI|nr:hypothetical protein [Tanacetum cinerariifolium]
MAKANMKVDVTNLPGPAHSKIWHTLQLDDSKDKFKFIIDQEEVTFSVDDFYTVLKLPQATDNDHAEFMEPPEFSTIVEFMNIHVLSRCLTLRPTGIYQPPLTILKIFYVIINNTHVDYVPLIWDNLHYQLMNPSTTKPAASYPKYTKLIIHHILTKHHDIYKRANEPHHSITNDDYVKSIFATRNTKARGMGIPAMLLTEEIMQTNVYKVYDAEFKKIDVPMTQPQPKKKEKELGESSVPKIPLIFKIKKRQIDLEAPIPTADQIDLDNIIEAQQLSYTLAKTAQEEEAQANVKLVEKHLLDKDVNKIIKGNDSTVVEFADSMILNQEILGTKIDLRSDKERPTATNVDYVATAEKEESVEVALIWKKGKCIMEIRDLPIVTPTRSPKIHLSSDKDEILKELTAPHAPSSKIPPSPSSKHSRKIQGALV